MNTISDLLVIDGSVRWKNRNEQIEVSNIGVFQADADQDKELVFLLVRKSCDDVFLKILSASGDCLAVLSPPIGFDFSYLSRHPDIGVAVVAGANQRVEGWFDWHFGYDEARKALFRHCPAY